MKRASKWLLIMLAIVLIASVALVGCGTKEEPPKTAEPSEAMDYLQAGLKELGLEKLPTVKLSYNTNEAHQKIAEAVQAMWTENLGVDVQLSNQEWKVYLESMKAGDFQIARLGWLSDYMDPMSFLDFFITDGGNNDGKYSNPEYDKFLALAKGTGDQEKRLEYLSAAEKILMEDAGMAPIYFYTYVKVINKNLKDVVIHGDGAMDYTWAYIDDPAAGNNLVLNARTEPPTLDPAQATDTTSFDILRATFDGLVRLDKDDAVVKGSAMAKDWVVSEDLLTYTFTLKDGLKWSNGDALVAGDFEYAWKKVLNPDTAADYAYQMYYIKNAEAYNAGNGTANDVGVKALDDKTLQVVLEAPTPYFLQLTAFGSYYPVNQKVDEANEDWSAEASTYVSNGPFKLESWKHDNEVVVVKNENYWNKDAVKLNQIKWLMVIDDNTAYQLFKNNEILMDDAPHELTFELLKSGEAISIPITGTYMYLFNNEDPIFGNANIRKAFSLAIDRDALVNEILKGGQLPATGYVPPGASSDMGVDFRENNGNLLK